MSTNSPENPPESPPETTITASEMQGYAESLPNHPLRPMLIEIIFTQIKETKGKTSGKKHLKIVGVKSPTEVKISFASLRGFMQYQAREDPTLTQNLKTLGTYPTIKPI